jgi:hypothetical protein
MGRGEFHGRGFQDNRGAIAFSAGPKYLGMVCAIEFFMEQEVRLPDHLALSVIKCL